MNPTEMANLIRDDWFDHVLENEGWSPTGDDGVDYALARMVDLMTPREDQP